MNKSIKKQFAFTLIELLVVIAIIGILSALIVVGMSSATQKATIAKAQVFSNSLRNSLMNDLISEWKFDAINSPAANQTPDSWSGGNTGTLAGAGGSQNLPQLQTTGCVSGNCLSFDGTDDYVDCGSGSSLNITNAITIEAWAKIPTGISIGQYAEIVSRGTSWDYPNYDGYQIRPYDSSISAVFIVKGDAAYSANYNADLRDGKWHHYVSTYSANAKLWVDGAQRDSVPTQSVVFSNVYNSNLQIGKYLAYTTNTFSGLIDNVRIYKEAMPTAQIEQNYFTGLNRLLANNQINDQEYGGRLVELTKNYAKD